MYDRLPYSAEEEQTPKSSCIVTLVTPLNFLMVNVFTQAKRGIMCSHISKAPLQKDEGMSGQ